MQAQPYSQTPTVGSDAAAQTPAQGAPADAVVPVSSPDRRVRKPRAVAQPQVTVPLSAAHAGVQPAVPEHVELHIAVQESGLAEAQVSISISASSASLGNSLTEQTISDLLQEREGRHPDASRRQRHATAVVQNAALVSPTIVRQGRGHISAACELQQGHCDCTLGQGRFA